MTNDEKKTLLQQRYAELDDESLCALERHKLTEQARELFDAELARRGLDLAAYEARHGDSLYRSRTALRRRQWRGVGLKAILAGIIFVGAALVRQQYGASLDAMEALPVAAGGLALVILVLAFALMLPLAACKPNVPETVSPTPMISSSPMPEVTSTPEGMMDEIGEAGKDIADGIGDAAKDVTDGVKNAMQ